MKRIIINGKEYKDLKDLPEMFQSLLKDENKDGTPDIAEEAIKKGKTASTSSSVQAEIEKETFGEIDKLSPQEREFIAKNMHKAKKFLNNPLLAGFAKNVAGIDLNELSQKIEKQVKQADKSIKKTKNIIDQKPISEKTTKKAKKTAYFEPFKSKKASHTHIPKSPLPSSDNMETGFQNKLDGRVIIGTMAIVGLIGWLLYQYTDII